MSRWQPLWLLLSFGLAAGLNHLMRPRADYALSPGERTMGTGKLWLDIGGQRQELEVVTIHAVAEDLPRLFAEPLRVRELWLRSPEQDGLPPDVELFIDFEPAEPAAATAPLRDVEPLRNRELLVRARAEGADVRSRVRLHGETAPSYVRDGRLFIDEAVDVAGEAQAFRIHGQLGLTLDRGEQVAVVQGELNARLVWQ